MLHVPPDSPLEREPGPAYREPTRFFDSDDPAVRRVAEEATAGAADEIERGVRLFYRVRDGWRYDPFDLRLTPHDHTASTVLAASSGYCVTKAVLLAALARSVGIASAIGLSDVTNHLSSERLTREMGGSTLFVNHGYTLLHLCGRWVKAAPAFNIELCERFGVRPTEFDGRSDAILQEFDAAGRKHMEYVRHHGSWSDLPYERIERDMIASYPDSTLIRNATGKAPRPASTERDAFSA